MGLEKKIQDIIKKNKLFNHNNKLLIGISGGVDSIVLSYVLKKLNYDIILAHCNFKLRGEESDEDENFVLQFAKNLNIKIHCKAFNTYLYSKEKKISIQEAARELRYNYFNYLLIKYKYDYILTAHNYNDNIETFFINLFRSTGIEGLKGIPLKSDKIIRPLIFINRSEILEYANENNLKWREDSSNYTDKYLRNAIRNRLIPVVNCIEKKFLKNFSYSLNNIIQNIELYNWLKKEFLKNKIILNDDTLEINIENFEFIPHSYILIYEVLKNYNFSIKQIKDFFSLPHQKGKKIKSATHVAYYENKKIIVTKKNDNINKEEYYIKKESQQINKPIKLILKVIKNDETFVLKKDKNFAYLDYSKLKFPLTIRKWEKGDRFIPLGMKNFKKLSDFFTDIKLNNAQKENIWLLCSGNDIVWVIGHRIDDRYKVADSTENILCIELLN
ncbi:MAG: tRNA lysidine(34) synthetase TilS [Bacteroidales bacterium]|nr:tRNA lysidine(34) synthetase TilS [Bacteroidales bacterium]